VFTFAAVLAAGACELSAGLAGAGAGCVPPEHAISHSDAESTTTADRKLDGKCILALS
jgi:hypothetical protein